MSATEKHLHGITEECLESYREEVFSLYASSNGVKIGFNGVGEYVVIDGDSVRSFGIAKNAIEFYKEIVRSKNK